MMVVSGIGLLLIVIAAVGAPSQRHVRRTRTAHEILDARMASGEIDPDEYRRRRDQLES